MDLVLLRDDDNEMGKDRFWTRSSGNRLSFTFETATLFYFSAMKPLIESSTPEAVKEFAVETLKTAVKVMKEIGTDLEKYSK